LVITGLSSILALGSLGLPFHPSLAGLVLLLVCAAGLYITVRWSIEKYPSCLHRHSAFSARVVVFTRPDRLIAAPPRLLRALLIGVTTDY
jgi:hypothetical protein